MRFPFFEVHKVGTLRVMGYHSPTKKVVGEIPPSTLVDDSGSHSYVFLLAETMGE